MWPGCIEKGAYIAWVNTLYFRLFFIMSLPPSFCFMVHRHVHIPHFFLSFFYSFYFIIIIILLLFLHSKDQFSRWWIVNFSSYMFVFCLLSACTFHCLPLLHVNSSRNLINGGKVYSFFMCHVFLWILKLDMLILNTYFLYRWIPSSSVLLKTQFNWIWLATAHFR